MNADSRIEKQRQAYSELNQNSTYLETRWLNIFCSIVLILSAFIGVHRRLI